MSEVYVNESVNHRTTTTVYGPDGSRRTVTKEESVYIDECVPVDDSVYIGMDFCVSKAREDEGLVSGWANVAKGIDGKPPLDWQDDIISPAELEKAAINFMLDYRDSGEMHKGKTKGTVVESIVMTKEKQAAMGIPEGVVPEGWFITVKVTDPEVFAKVKDGTYRMFSIQGKAKRVEVQ